ncbi:MAG: Imm40 family immunity protein, partial [Candidatus Rickettsiella isopodorum]|nr:Imm40 family immunity protein [Candidatus Rickettsiella isopodorum]
ISKNDALVAIGILKKLNIPLLGVDILVEENGKFRHRPEGWYSELTEHRDSESVDQYIKRSLADSESYLKEFREVGIGKYYYVLVPGRSLPEVEEKERIELRETINQWKYLGADEGNYDWLVDPILSQLRYGINFEELKEFIVEQITTHFHIPIIYNMNIDSNVRQVFDWYEQ